jgi:hypothetical protein
VRRALLAIFLLLAVYAHAQEIAQIATDAEALAAERAVQQRQHPPGAVVGNPNSHIYFWPGCPNYSRLKHRVTFPDAKAAIRAGYRPARNCR